MERQALETEDTGSTCSHQMITSQFILIKDKLKIQFGRQNKMKKKNLIASSSSYFYVKV